MCIGSGGRKVGKEGGGGGGESTEEKDAKE